MHPPACLDGGVYEIAAIFPFYFCSAATRHDGGIFRRADIFRSAARSIRIPSSFDRIVSRRD